MLVSFVVCEDGSIIDIKILESSGYSLLDTNAIKIVQKVSKINL
ncbi:MAG: energy transducer TonB [Proteobacteria bacterium]|nr:energy transducer TonB [Pseudomonadota bacterium]MBU1710458.1 energy transducer TonB [Pseudomonadota bacterium]